MASENIDNLSFGALQKISIARAMYKDCYILILDEPFSALYKKSVDTLLDFFFFLLKDKIVIAHNVNIDKIFNLIR